MRGDGPGVARPCVHGGRHPHGDPNRYRQDGCRCAKCTDGSRVAAARWELRVLEQGPELVDPGPAVARLRGWQALGLGARALSAHTGVSTSTLEVFLYRRVDPRRRVDTRMARRTSAAILTAPEPGLDVFPDRALVPAVGTARRLQALYALGWSVREVADRAGSPMHTVRDLHRKAQVSAKSARLVRAVYDAMWDEVPAPRTATAAGRVKRRRGQAAAAGWVPPLAWDDDTIDDPSAVPSGAAGTSPVLPSVHVDAVEDVLGVSPAVTTRELAERFGVAPSSIQNHLKRKGREDLLAVLARNARLTHNLPGRAA